MKLVITESQRLALIHALEGAINPDYPATDPDNAQYLRLIKKLGGNA